MGRQKRFLLCVLASLVLVAACTTDPEARKQRLLETGNKYFDDGMYREASLVYRRALQQDMRFGEAYYKLGLSELELGRIAPAIAALTRATELLPENEDAYSRLADLYIGVLSSDPENRDAYLTELNRLTERAEQYFEDSFDVYKVRGLMAVYEGDFETATERFLRATELRPDDAVAAVGLAESYRGAGDPVRAEQLARSFLESHPSDSRMANFLYGFLYSQERRDEALQVLQEKRDRDPSTVANWLLLARHYYVTGDEAKAMEMLNELLARPDVDPMAFEQVGDFYVAIRAFDSAIQAYRDGAAALPARETDLRLKVVEVLSSQGNLDQASDLVEEVLRQDAENPQALALRAALRLRTGAPEALQQAINDFESVLARMPENVVLRYNLGEVYLAAGNRDRAIVEFQQALERRPDYLLPRYGLARVYLISEDFPRAVDIAEQILELQPDDQAAQLIRSYAWVNMGQRRQARESLETMLQETPQAPEATYQLARLSIMERDYRQAERLYQSLADATPPDPRGILGLAETRILTGRASEGMELLEEQRDQNPDNLWWKLAVGVAATRSGDWNTAESSLNEVLAMQPDNADALKHLAGVYYQTGRIDAARQQFERAAAVSPMDPAVHLYLALIAEREGRFEEAVARYEEVVTLSPDNLAALNNLAYLLAETTDELDRALTLAQRAVSSSPDSLDVADTLGWVYVKKNLNDNAINILEELVAKQPSNVVWRYHLATAYYQKGDYARAKSEVETALGHRPTNEQENDLRRLLARVSS